MRDQDKQRFSQGMSVLRDCYPSYRPTTDEFKRTMAAYWAHLEHLPLEAVEKACLVAANPELHPDRFPTAGQLRHVAEEQCRAIDAAKAREREREGAVIHDPSELLREFVRTVPSTPDGQTAYVNCGLDDWDRLGRMWQCESRRLGIKPHEATPDDVGKRRLREFWAMWKRKAEDPAERSNDKAA